MVTLSGSSVLLLAPKFFGYESEIKKEFELLGAKVWLYDERPKNDFITKVAIRAQLSKMTDRLVVEYYTAIQRKIVNQSFDFIFIVNPECITPYIIAELKSLNPNAKIIVYMWDSVRNKPGSLKLISSVDRFVTFDKNDCMYSDKIEFHPLFYIRQYEGLKSVKTHKYQASFIGTIHSDRYKIVTSVRNDNDDFFLFFFSPSKILFYFQKMFLSDFKEVKCSDISFTSLSHNILLDKIKESNAIIDVEHPEQVGLTMRTIEMLGAKKKLVTTNQDIVNYDFFNKNNIFVLDRNSPYVDSDFFNAPYEEIDNDIYKKYSLRSWIIHLVDF